ncbi:sigma-54 interaction domain-containing protein [Alteribacillus sp. JSM 102045]|uniref:sigma-54 interaction domain-containing protein n=1 Tax=Alteribacillus sp. JSM 102045 TaxID=1562101 RepID=UPI0035BF657B
MTNHKSSVNKMIQNNKLLDSIIQSSYDGIYVADAEGNGLKVNEAYTRITNVKPEQLLGKNMRDVVEEGIVSESVTFKVLEEKKPITIMQKVNGVEVIVTGNPVFDEEGSITHVVTNVRDLTELTKLKLELNESRAYTKKILEEIDSFKNQEKVKMMLDGVIAQSQEIMKVVSLAQKVSNVDSTVILMGESGVGKEVFANMIHSGSKRAGKPYIKVNCGAIPSQLLESELFGYEKGSFTGADRNGKTGFFEQADGGTIFLDEISEIPLELQVKLLRVLQEFEVMRIGSTKVKKIDVRVIAASNKDLEQQVKMGVFREDLYYRLNIVPVRIPPLRERKADIAPLAYFFLNKVNKKYKLNKRFQPEAVSFMQQYRWPGNIREMENLIERIAVTTDHDEINLQDFPNEMVVETIRDEKSNQPESHFTKENSLKDLVMELEKNVITERFSKNQTTRKTAESLGISQSALVKKMKKLNLTKEEILNNNEICG